MDIQMCGLWVSYLGCRFQGIASLAFSDNLASLFVLLFLSFLLLKPQRSNKNLSSCGSRDMCGTMTFGDEALIAMPLDALYKLCMYR